MKSKSATLEDVAHHAGVSYQTVSRVLNKSANVSEATRSKVEKSIELLRYVPNRLAQQLVGKTSKTIGLVTTSLALHAPSQVAAAVKRYANLENYQVLISMIDENVHNGIKDSINELKSQLVDKVIINVPLETEYAEKIVADNTNVQCLFLDVDPYSSVFNVSFNPADGTRSSVKYLYELGHREIALLSGPDSSVSAKLRLKSWIETLDGYGLQPAAVVKGNWDAQSGYAGALQMLRSTPNFSAVLVANDQMALGVLSAFHQHQISIPGEKSVIGYDDTYESSFFHPALTTVSLDLDLQGKEAVRRILDSSHNDGERSSSILPARLVIRNSTGPKQEKSQNLQAIAEQLSSIARILAR
ncbi:LacI family DNA-binding transcriptional regulator [Enterobacteriaceae bacterium H20N1]|uniref:LacI family DNA-binding transcriptional regulator n=1 Tax=Dryocola boscaweniae TaxID=2925397 RepID=A0A9X2W465_9ENTR|nr:LacI family DNA-binding transcriptional regulator [Dryocola boscaweniae]MCT4700405.1 LacI family DNA-binding transcriptional regulator [Dryocola boscaweniae]MCT4721502.1 LacI family DNA-binding transcriptional regulator [Dryocola boscaweniae]